MMSDTGLARALEQGLGVSVEQIRILRDLMTRLWEMPTHSDERGDVIRAAIRDLEEAELRRRTK